MAWPPVAGVPVRRLMLRLRAVLFYLGLAASTMVYAPLGLLLFPLPFAVRYRAVMPWTRFNLWSLQVCCGVDYEVIGRENIPPRPGVVLCKHQSVFETLALQLLFVPQVWVLKRELLYIPIYGWGLAALQPIAINRAAPLQAFKQLLEQGRKQLALGRWVVIFPEGTRAAVGETLPYQPGGAMLASKAGADITPISHNAGYLWSRHALAKEPGKIRVVIGPVIRSEGKSTQHLMEEARDWIESTATTLPDPRAAAGGGP